MDENIFYVQELDCSAVILTYTQYEFEKIYYNLQKSLFYSDCKFFSFTKTNDEISLFIDYNIYKDNLLDTKINTDIEIYKVLQIYETYTGVDHIGIVKILSSLFADKNIPILYVNSVNNNYILIKESYLDITKEILQKENYIFYDK